MIYEKCDVKWIMLAITFCCVLVGVVAEPPKTAIHHHHHHQRAPLVFKTWPPITRSSSISPYRSTGGMLLQLRGSGSTNIVSRVPVPNMFIKTYNPMQLAMPMRLASRPSTFGTLKSAPSTHIYFKTGPPKKHATFTSSQPIFKYSSPGGHKTAIKFKSPPPLKTKPEIVFEKVTVPKFAEPIIANEAAIHQIAAPNLSLNQLDNDLTKTSIQAFGSAFEKPVHNYQVQENFNDLTIKNVLTGQKTLFAPDNDPSLKSRVPIKPVINDPINSPSDGKPKPSDVLYHQNIDFNASPLVQQHFAIDPFQFPVTAQPQLQQYHLQQNAMLTSGMPLAAYNPTYLVQMSNNLLGQHQQHLTPQLFSPAQGYIDTSSFVHPQVTAPPTEVNYEVASLGQIAKAQKDIDEHHLKDNVFDVSAASQNVPIHQLPEPKPNNYFYSQNFIDLPDAQLTAAEVENALNFDEIYRRQIENDLILKEAHQKLNGKIELQKKQEQVAGFLHQQALAEQFSPLHIVVPDEDQEFKRRSDNNNDEGDNNDDTYVDDEGDAENDHDELEETEEKSSENEKS